MPRPKKDRIYYGVTQEKAVVAFLKSESVEEKERIYREYLRDAIDKMIESIIRKYGLYRPGYDFVDLHADALSFLITKFDRYKPERGKKSYSYFGTVCKHYLYNEMIKADKHKKSIVSSDETEPEFLHREDLLYRIDEPEVDLTNFIERLADMVKEELKSDDLTDDEFKVGHALVRILESWRELFYSEGVVKNSTKFNKNLILLYIRNITDLDTKQIRKSMKRFKSLYGIFKDKYLDE